MFKKDITIDEFWDICDDIRNELNKFTKDFKVIDCDFDNDFVNENGDVTIYFIIEKNMYIHGKWNLMDSYWDDYEEDYVGDIEDEEIDVPYFKLTDFFPSFTNLPVQIGKYKLLSADINNEDINIDYDFNDIKNKEYEFHDGDPEDGYLQYTPYIEVEGDIFADVGVSVKFVFREEDEN